MYSQLERFRYIDEMVGVRIVSTIRYSTRARTRKENSRVQFGKYVALGTKSTWLLRTKGYLAYLARHTAIPFQ